MPPCGTFERLGHSWPRTRVQGLGTVLLLVAALVALGSLCWDLAKHPRVVTRKNQTFL